LVVMKSSNDVGLNVSIAAFAIIRERWRGNYASLSTLACNGKERGKNDAKTVTSV